MTSSQPFPIVFQFNPLFEFGHAADFVANKEQIRSIFREFGEELAANEWIEQMDSRLSRFLRSELYFFFSHPFKQTSLGTGLLNDLSITQSSPPSVSEALDVLEQYDAVRLAARMVQSALEDVLPVLLSGRKWNDVQQFPQQIEELLRQVPETHLELAERLKECLAHTEETKQRYVSLCRMFYKNIYHPIEEEISSLSKAGAKKYEDLYMQDPFRFAETYLLDTTEEHLQQPCYIHISVFDQACSVRHPFRANGTAHHWIRLGLHLDRLLKHKPKRQQVDLFLKLLSDKKRIILIETLAERPHYHQELAKKLNLTPAAISHHMDFFYSLDLVSVEKKEQRHYYRLDQDKMKTYFAWTQEVLLSQ